MPKPAKKAPQKPPVRTPDEFNSSFEKNKNKIMAEQAKLFANFKNPVDQEFIKKINIPSDETKLKTYTIELEKLRDNQAANLEKLLKAQKNDLDTLKTPTHYHGMRAKLLETEGNHKKALNDQLQKDKAELEKFLKSNLENIYDLKKEEDKKGLTDEDKKRNILISKEINKKRDELIPNVDKLIHAQKTVQNEIYKDASDLINAQNKDREALYGKYESRDSIDSKASKEGAENSRPTVPSHLRHEYGTNAFSDKGIVTANIANGSLGITRNMNRFNFLGINYLQAHYEKKAIEAGVERMLARTEDWSKPFNVKGDAETSFNIAQALAKNGIDPLTNMNFETPPTSKEYEKLSKIYTDKMNEKQAEKTEEIKPFAKSEDTNVKAEGTPTSDSAKSNSSPGSPTPPTSTTPSHS